MHRDNSPTKNCKLIELNSIKKEQAHTGLVLFLKFLFWGFVILICFVIRVVVGWLFVDDNVLAALEDYHADKGYYADGYAHYYHRPQQ